MIVRKISKCERCGVIAGASVHLCQPRALAGKEDYCGQPVEENGSVCISMAKSLDYECETCGRPTADPALVCRPVRI